MLSMPTSNAASPLTSRLLALLFPLLASVVASAQQGPTPTAPAPAEEASNPRPFFWRIEGKVPSYLFGTFHLPDERITDVNPEVERALGEADAVFTEIEMDMGLTPALLKAMRLPAGKTLRDIAPPELVQRVLARLGIADRADSPALAMQPWVVSMQVLLHGKTGGGEPLDLQVYKDAKSAGKEVGGLETIEEQMAVFEGIGVDGGVALLKLTLDILDDYQKRGLDLTEEMIKAYCAGDTPRLLAFFEEMNGDRELWGELSRSLLTDRNLRMAERIERKLRALPEQKFVFAVGAGHLIGETNIVDLLRTRGYVVTRIPETLANLDEELETLLQEVAQRQARIEQLQARRATLAAKGLKKAG